MTKAIFLDRDGVINKNEIRYVNSPEDFELISGVPEAISTFHQLGYLRIVVTNQKGVAMGRLSEEDLDTIHEKMIKEIKPASVTDIYYCIDKDESSPNRKPNPGMILNAIKKYKIDPTLSYMVGDMETDIIAGERAGVTTVFIGDASILEQYRAKRLSDQGLVFSNLLGFAKYLQSL